ncbi:protocatechuate 3,4-dioxygenase subunit alpha [Nocardioides sp. AX2bis]|uniref:protocatechuate 3,4-dioxygenase subunit alpha n=1 Tax=Nocardioides sp. AX2bis TaxID=2653157 RepID=UPI0012F22BF1|nr:protocatechuate 3,4-dioxygenase subunit alpha [Nocardioides sp. AX2bis]VXC57776.1 Protocatechuate 3,4-dioxygenase alpha chain [Nocardioides sp. AX2bis]
MSDLPPTPGQTVGPFFHDALPWTGDAALVPPGRADAVRLHGVVRDGAGDPVPDALVELWQAGQDGRVVQRPGSLHRDGHTFTGFGRCATDRAGSYSFTTVLPGAHAEGAAPFVSLTVFARGLLHRLLTRAYLPVGLGGTAEALAADPLLAGLDPGRRATLVCEVDDDGGGAGGQALRRDLVLQGPGETVWLTYPRLPHGG